MPNKRITLQIHGLVQGIGYRYLSREKAITMGLTGYVRNGPDGTVELVAEGSEEDLKQFIDWCYTGVGPATVQEIKVTWSAPTGEFSHFGVK